MRTGLGSCAHMKEGKIRVFAVPRADGTCLYFRRVPLIFFKKTGTSNTYFELDGVFLELF